MTLPKTALASHSEVPEAASFQMTVFASMSVFRQYPFLEQTYSAPEEFPHGLEAYSVNVSVWRWKCRVY